MYIMDTMLSTWKRLFSGEDEHPDYNRRTTQTEYIVRDYGSVYSFKDRGLPVLRKDLASHLFRQRVKTNFIPIMKLNEKLSRASGRIKRLPILTYREAKVDGDIPLMLGDVFTADQLYLTVRSRHQADYVHAEFVVIQESKEYVIAGGHVAKGHVFEAKKQWQYGGVWAVSTLPEFRRMGLSTIIMNALEHMAVEFWQAQELRLGASPEGRLMYEKLGYVGVAGGRGMIKNLRHYYKQEA